MRKLFVALGLAAGLMVGSVAVDGRVISAAVPGGPEIAATLNTMDTALAAGRGSGQGSPCTGSATSNQKSGGKSQPRSDFVCL